MDNSTPLLATIVDESITEQKYVSCVERTFTYNRLLIVFLCMNLLNYIERVVVSGSSVKMLEFIRLSVNSHENTYLGALTSVFIGGFSLASVLFGYYVTKYPPFKVVSIGLICWLLAAVASGLAPNYWVLLVARMVSGVGEAAFQIVVPAYINEKSPKEKLGSSVALLYSAISIGTAIGFIMSGWVSQKFSWRLMYLVIAPLMLPAIFILYQMPYSLSAKAESETKFSFVSATFRLVKSPLFILLFLVEAAGVYLCGAYLAFGNQILINLGFFDNEATSSLVYGAMCCCAGVVGSLIGGWTLNRIKVDETFSQARCLNSYSKHLMYCTMCCVIFFAITTFTVRIPALFFGSFFIGFSCVFASNPSWTLIVLNSTSAMLRPMALGVATVMYHIFGDVPAPIIVGRFLDYFLYKAGTNSYLRWLAYLYTHWFIMLSILVMVALSISVYAISKRAYKVELSALEIPEQPEQIIQPIIEIVSESVIIESINGV